MTDWSFFGPESWKSRNNGMAVRRGSTLDHKRAMDCRQTSHYMAMIVGAAIVCDCKIHENWIRVRLWSYGNRTIKLQSYHLRAMRFLKRAIAISILLRFCSKWRGAKIVLWTRSWINETLRAELVTKTPFTALLYLYSNFKTKLGPKTLPHARTMWINSLFSFHYRA